MLQFLEKLGLRLNQAFMALGGVVLVAMIVLTCANILLRGIWIPIPGTFELMGFFGAMVTAFALGYTQTRRGHIAVDVLVDTFSNRTRRILAGINRLLCLVFFALAAWQVAKKAMILKHSGELTETLRIVYYPFTLAVALGCALLGLILFIELCRVFFPAQSGDGS